MKLGLYLKTIYPLVSLRRQDMCLKVGKKC